jgi:GntR family transcriptional repressor for pyruvate dehydrogenase complex
MDMILFEIREGKWKNEKKLPSERKLAEIFGVSRTLVSSVISSLEAKGKLHVREREGIFINIDDPYMANNEFTSIRQWPKDLLLNVMEVRSIIEVPSSRLAANRRTEDDLEKLEECIENLDEKKQNKEEITEEGAFWDFLFHETIILSAHNELLSRIYEGISGLTRKYATAIRSYVFTAPEHGLNSYAEHYNIFLAIKNQDPDSAAAWVEKHLLRARKGYDSLKLSSINEWQRVDI